MKRKYRRRKGKYRGGIKSIYKKLKPNKIIAGVHNGLPYAAAEWKTK